MEDADQAALELLADDALDPAIVEAVTKRAVAELLAGAPDTSAERERLAGEIAQVDAESQRLTTAIAAGGDLPGLLDALRVRDERRSTLRTKLDSLNASTTTVPLDEAVIEARVRERLAEWRGLLGRQVAWTRHFSRSSWSGR
jgi:hypothetical protein